MKYFLRSLIFIAFCLGSLYGDELSEESFIDDTGIYEAISNYTAITQSKNGKFIGLSAGGSLLFQDVHTGIIPTLGIKGGVYTFFNHYVGVRGFMDFIIGVWGRKSILAMISLGIDAIAEFPLSTKKGIYLGGLLGIGGDAYIFYDEINHSSFSDMRKRAFIAMQAGITLALGKHNRIDAIYRIIPSKSATQFDPNGVFAFEYTYKF